MSKGVMLRTGGSIPLDLTATPNKVLYGVRFIGAGRTLETGTIQKRGASTITPTTSDQTLQSGIYLSGPQTIRGDSNLISSNIRSGVTIFGVSGSA